MIQTLADYLHGVGTLEQVVTEADFEALVDAVRADYAGRLRWQIALRLGQPPPLRTRDDYLYALAQLSLDHEPCCPVFENENFDENRFEELKQYGTAAL